MFEIGKVYKHSGSGSRIMHIIGGLQTTAYGGCLIAEEVGSSNLKPVGQDKESAINWVEITMVEWMSHFS